LIHCINSGQPVTWGEPGIKSASYHFGMLYPEKCCAIRWPQQIRFNLVRLQGAHSPLTEQARSGSRNREKMGASHCGHFAGKLGILSDL